MKTCIIWAVALLCASDPLCRAEDSKPIELDPFRVNSTGEPGFRVDVARTVANGRTYISSCFVSEVIPDSLAYKAGVKEGSELVAIDGVRLAGADMKAFLERFSIGPNLPMGTMLTYVMSVPGGEKKVKDVSFPISSAQPGLALRIVPGRGEGDGRRIASLDVIGVDVGSVAEKAGIEFGMRVVRIDGVAVEGMTIAEFGRRFGPTAPAAGSVTYTVQGPVVRKFRLPAMRNKTKGAPASAVASSQ